MSVMFLLLDLTVTEYLFLYLAEESGICFLFAHINKNHEHTSETLASFNWTTRRNIPEDSNLHTRRRENMKSQIQKEVDKPLLFLTVHVCSVSFSALRLCSRVMRFEFLPDYRLSWLMVSMVLLILSPCDFRDSTFK
jgi:hypothetical protein